MEKDVLILINAERAREIATDIRNKEISNCLSILMNEIREEAQKGGLCKVVYVKPTRPNGFFELLEKIFKELGYSINYQGYEKGLKRYLIEW